MRMTVLSSLRSAGGLLRALRQRVDQLTAMLERQRRTQAQVEAFSANVAHELRTPLATLITGTEFTMRDASLPPEARDRLGTHLEELRRMQGIVGDMLFLSRAYGGHRARRQRVDSLAALAAEVAEYHDAAIEEAGLSLRVEGEAAGDFDAALLKRALSNLIANATRYATVGSVLRVGIEGARSGQVRLWVANLGRSFPRSGCRDCSTGSIAQAMRKPQTLRTLRTCQAERTERTARAARTARTARTVPTGPWPAARRRATITSVWACRSSTRSRACTAAPPSRDRTNGRRASG
ncbi:histidine kinase dimerization/phospho-acceptor domain-containing protein [Roseateles sp. UC29_93]|uniref:histidine kinase dimerization/phospho-acceptor domain-containing protein n=1 Tax=Roseateles sp. UC29_93 TaxID=3350177 RepID=UPI00366C2D38